MTSSDDQHDESCSIKPKQSPTTEILGLQNYLSDNGALDSQASTSQPSAEMVTIPLSKEGKSHAKRP